MSPRLLDLFCGAGGAAMGYHRAGFEVVGVDIKPQPHYPFEFHQGDVMEIAWDFGEFDAVHASPPCQDHSVSKHTHRAHGTGWMLGATLAQLRGVGVPWIVENVEGAPLPTQPTLDSRYGTVLCGASFGLTATDDDEGALILRRHRVLSFYRRSRWSARRDPYHPRVPEPRRGHNAMSDERTPEQFYDAGLERDLVEIVRGNVRGTLGAHLGRDLVEFVVARGVPSSATRAVAMIKAQRDLLIRADSICSLVAHRRLGETGELPYRDEDGAELLAVSAACRAAVQALAALGDTP